MHLTEEATPKVKAFDKSLHASYLNIEEKSRSNLFSWRGQFTPQLVENLIKAYGPESGTVLDPFMGSGTVLVEAARLGLGAVGCEVNPAALLLASTYTFINYEGVIRDDLLEEAELVLQSYFSQNVPLFEEADTLNNDGIEKSILAALSDSKKHEVKQLITTLAISLDFGNKSINAGGVWNNWERLRQLIKQLPYSKTHVETLLADARKIPIEDDSIDFVITSPPYINVFNYHQNYRKTVESLGWQPLMAASSEIGANRKFRQNRLITVIQYCIDMAMVLHELQRVCKPNSNVIFIVGRESNVRKTPFFNSKLIEEIACKNGYKLVLIQERVFTNKFGQSIFEDLLHLVPSKKQLSRDIIISNARQVAFAALEDAWDRAPKEVHEDLRGALAHVDKVNPSAFLNLEKS